MPKENKNVAVVCSTFRNPDKPSALRLIGTSMLAHQMLNQDFEGDIKIVIVDDSADPHPFFANLPEAYRDNIIYLHTPSRENVPAGIQERYPEACKFYPKDEDFEKDTFWRAKCMQVEAWMNFLPFDYEFAKTFSVNMLEQVKAERPTIGMKKNLGCQAYIEHTGQVPDVFVFADDDDFHAPNYVSQVVDALGSADFARMIHTYAHNVSPDPQHQFWGEINFRPYKDANGNWMLPDEIMDAEAYKYEDGEVIKRPVHDLYQRNLLNAWPILSHDGALHNYTGKAWVAARDKFGGFFPTSFSEDIITHRLMHQLPNFNSKSIEVEAPAFLRCSDGRNCSDFYVTDVIDNSTVLPEWIDKSLRPVYQSHRYSYEEVEELLADIGVSYDPTSPFELVNEEEIAPANSPRYG